MEHLEIPPHLLAFTEADWPVPTGGMLAASTPEVHAALASRESWRKAQDRWAQQHHLDRGTFERLALRQRDAEVTPHVGADTTAGA
jgi:hypothetical protein